MSRLSRGWMACGFALLVGVAAAGAETGKAQKLLAKGHSDLDAGRLGKAEKTLREADAAAGGDWFPARLALARVALAREDGVEAAAAAQRLLAAAAGPGEESAARALEGAALLLAYHHTLAARFPGAPQQAEGAGATDANRLLAAAEHAYRASTSGESVVEEAWLGLAHALWHGRDLSAARAAIDRHARARGSAADSSVARALASCIDEFSTAPPRQLDEGSATEAQPPRRVSGRPPFPTGAAQRARVQGTVVVNAVIDADGLLRCPEVLRGLPLGVNESVLEALATWRFEPARVDGVPTPVWYQLSINIRSSG